MVSFVDVAGDHVGRYHSLAMDVISYLYAAVLFIGGLIGYFKAGELIIISSRLLFLLLYPLAWSRAHTWCKL